MDLSDSYRNISRSEIEVMQSNGCICENWSKVLVKNGFDPSHFRNVKFSGNIRLGIINSSYNENGNAGLKPGIENARLHNCSVGSDVVIYNIGECISNYVIEDRVNIINCGKIHTEGITSFGNGIEVSVLIETGKRSVKIWDGLSSSEAYLSALYRHRPEVNSAIGKMIDIYSGKVSSSSGTIGHDSSISGCNEIRNVKFGPYSKITGSLLLNDGSVNSCSYDPVIIEHGVIIEHFIANSGSRISGSSIIEKCFIGQGCIFDKHFSAENSLFFSCSDGLNGEASSVFAGPYTVSHHKSTLLIAGLFSFMNAGSGTNQSNHMYKLGPVHQGIMERGSKTSSNSYITWPSYFGPFTFVTGSHYKNLDSSHLPFSYVVESKEGSFIIPAVNLRSIGTMRDIEKWPNRDRRKDPEKQDFITFDQFNPFTVGRMVIGKKILQKLSSVQTTDIYHIGNLYVKSSSICDGIELYQNGIDRYVGESVIKRLGDSEFTSIEELRKILVTREMRGSGEWVDLAGLIAPKQEVDLILDEIESGKCRTSESLNDSLKKLYNSYNEYSWTWVCRTIEDEYGITVNKITVIDIIRIVEKYRKSTTWLNNLLYTDARKEFSSSSMTGYGIDGEDEAKITDFSCVRGEFETNETVNNIRESTYRITILCNDLISRIKCIR
jgi:hypothetical protein